MLRTLSLLTLSVLSLGLGHSFSAAQDISQSKTLFAKERWYKSQKGKEKNFIGIVSQVRVAGGGGFGRFNPYRLTISTTTGDDVREVYVGGKMELLAPYVLKRVQIKGKAIHMQVEGQLHREIWPASIAVVPKKPQGQKKVDSKGGKQLKIFKTARWPHARAVPGGGRKGQQFVIRKRADLFGKIQMPRVRVKDREAWLKLAEQKAAKMFGVDKIDWDKQMIVVVTAGVRPTGGYRVSINSLKVADKKLVVRYTVTPPQGIATQAFTHPAVTGLVEKFDGPVEFTIKANKRGRFRGRPIRRPRIDR